MVDAASVGAERLVIVPKLRLLALIAQFGVTVAVAVRERPDGCPPPALDAQFCCVLKLGL